MNCAAIRYARHAFERMFERSLSPTLVEAVIASGAIIQQYPDDQPFPSRLIPGWWDASPVHVVVAQDAAAGDCIVVTACIPDPKLWSADSKTRRNR
jgi:hypothetical protein